MRGRTNAADRESRREHIRMPERNLPRGTGSLAWPVM